jgi:predicted nucleotide-binding protein
MISAAHNGLGKKMSPRILFQGSYKITSDRTDTPDQLALAKPIASAIGKSLIARGFDLILMESQGSLVSEIGRAAVSECNNLNFRPRDRIRTYPYAPNHNLNETFGLVLQPINQRAQEIRTFVVDECDAVIALLGGKGTADCLQKAVLANKPVFPIPIAGGAAKQEWDRLRAAKYSNGKGSDIEFLADKTLKPEELANEISIELSRLLRPRSREPSRRIFIVHGHDSALKTQLARVLEVLQFVPVILAEQAEKGQALISKLHSHLADVAYAIVLYTPDDVAKSTEDPQIELCPRARQNVVFEHGILLGLLGPERICTIVKGEVELPSDLRGILTKEIQKDAGIETIAFDLVKELVAAGYQVDANRLLASNEFR